MTGNLLEAVVAAARRSADERERLMPRTVLEREMPRRTPAGVAFREALAQDGVRVIAECKRRSPSKGILRRNYDPAAIARGYEEAGAAAISVLTEPTFFDGSLEDLRRVRQAVGIPLLRKDFIVTPYQVHEAVHAGADAVLLIVAALDDETLRHLHALATDLGLATLIEVHDRAELDRALTVGAGIVGVNSRNLRTLAIRQATFDELGPQIPHDVVAVAESGLRTPDDLRRLRAIRYNAFLIGERFMTTENPGSALRALIAAVDQESL